MKKAGDQSILFHGITLGLCIPLIGLEKLRSCGIFHYVTRNVKQS